MSEHDGIEPTNELLLGALKGLREFADAEPTGPFMFVASNASGEMLHGCNGGTNRQLIAVLAAHLIHMARTTILYTDSPETRELSLRNATGLLLDLLICNVEACLEGHKLEEEWAEGAPQMFGTYEQ